MFCKGTAYITRTLQAKSTIFCRHDSNSVIQKVFDSEYDYHTDCRNISRGVASSQHFCIEGFLMWYFCLD